MAYWLIKSEPGDYSIDDLKHDKKTLWEGVRNYQARNFLRDQWTVGDQVLFYHSVTDPVGVAGVAKVSKIGLADPRQFEKGSKYYDEKSTKENPRWFAPQVTFVRKFKEVISLSDLRTSSKLKDMGVLKKGNRLSVQPVTKSEFETILKMAS